MTDAEVVREFLRIADHGGTTMLEVCRIEWDGPHTPRAEWLPIESMPDSYSEEHLACAMARAVGDQWFLRRCTECGVLKPCGWMDDESICQGCASDHHGVVY